MQQPISSGPIALLDLLLPAGSIQDFETPDQLITVGVAHRHFVLADDNHTVLHAGDVAAIDDE